MNNYETLPLAKESPLKYILIAVFVASLVPACSYFVAKYFIGRATQTQGSTPKNNQTEAVVEAASVSVFQKALEPIYSSAKRVYSEKPGFDMPLVEIGVDTDGSLGTPKEWKVGGWYGAGAKPGSNGNVIIDGHYDDNRGRPAAFWGLKNLDVGDKVYVVDDYGKSYTYQVFKVSKINIKDPNRLDVLNDTPNQPTLTLITCGGVWLPARATYNERLVVVANLVR